MAWTHSYGTATSVLGLMESIRDFLVSVGWTVADDYLTLGNAPFVALTSTGESGTDSIGLLFEVKPGTNYINVCSFVTWDTIATNMWTPGTGNTVSHNNRVFTKSSGAPVFTGVFSVGDYVSIFNSTTHDNNIYRCKLSGVTDSTLTLSSSYPFPYSSNSNVSNVIISKGGPNIYVKGSVRSTGAINCNTSTYYYFLFADKDTFICVTRIGTSYYSSYAGKYEPYHNEILDATTAQIVSGTDTSMIVSDGTKFTAGYKYMISNGRYVHMFTPTSIVGNTINFTAGLTGGDTGIIYPSGSKVGIELHPMCNTSGYPYFVDANNPVRICGNALATYANSAQGGNSGAWDGDGDFGESYNLIGVHANTLYTALYPDVINGKYAFEKYAIYSGKYVKGILRNRYAMNAQPGNSEDTIRLDNLSGATYKIFQATSSNDYSWHIIKE